MMSDESQQTIDTVSLSGSPNSELDGGFIQVHSPEDINNLISATILCSTCHAMLDQQDEYLRSSDPSNSAWNKHHGSYEQLQMAVLEGCQICTDLAKLWNPPGKDSDRHAYYSEFQVLKSSTTWNLILKNFPEKSDPRPLFWRSITRKWGL